MAEEAAGRPSDYSSKWHLQVGRKLWPWTHIFAHVQHSGGPCVYFLQAEHGGPIKIGFTQDLSRRLHALESTFATYETAYRVHLLPFLGETDIREISREQLKRFIYEKLNAGLSRNSVKGYLAPLSEMFNHAIEDGHLSRNPCVRILRTSSALAG